MHKMSSESELRLISLLSSMELTEEQHDLLFVQLKALLEATAKSRD